MYEASVTHAPCSDLFCASAAVADFRPRELQRRKMKKGKSETLSLELIKNPDIVAAVESLESKPFTVGFAAETNDVENYAKKKLAEKNLDLIIANDVSNSEIGFISDNNAVTVISKFERHQFDERRKDQLARDLIVYISRILS